MKSLVLVIEHRHCRCGETYIAPNPRPLTRHELENLRRTNATVSLPGDTYFRARREILHVDVPIDYCQLCFHILNGRQIEMFPDETRFQLSPRPLVFTNGKVEEQKPQKPLPFGLSYF